MHSTRMGCVVALELFLCFIDCQLITGYHMVIEKQKNSVTRLSMCTNCINAYIITVWSKIGQKNVHTRVLTEIIALTIDRNANKGLILIVFLKIGKISKYVWCMHTARWQGYLWI